MARAKRKNYSNLFGGLDLPKDRYDQNREGYVDEKGTYHYVTETRQCGATPNTIPLINQDGTSNEEFITVLAYMDHDVNIQKRNQTDHEDARFAAFKSRIDPASEEADTTPDPMDRESYRRYMEEKYQSGEERESKEEPLLKAVHEFILSLDENDRAIVLAIFDAGKQQKEIAAELGRTTQSVSRTIQRIKARLKKKLEKEFGI